MSLCGGLFFFKYQALHDPTLPYWDAYTLVVPLVLYPDGFGGLNLHYLPPAKRKIFFDFLMESHVKYRKRNYIDFSKVKMSIAVENHYLKPCYHRYLFSQMRSKFIKVEIEEWTNAVDLPVAVWKKGKPY